MREVTKELLFYSEFLNKSFDLVYKYLSDNYEDDILTSKQMDIYKQANWEMLVDMIISKDDECVEYYDSGADFYSDSYRVIKPNNNGNVKVVVSSNEMVFDYFSNEKVIIKNYDFIKFVSSNSEGYYSDMPIFDFIIIEDSYFNEYLVKKNSVLFFLVKS
jgi:hypothetical protein